MYLHRCVFISIVFLLSVLMAYAADTSAVILRAATPIRIDGNANEWAGVGVSYPLSGAVQNAASFQAVYDDTNLYLCVLVNDDSPMKNSTSRSDAPMLLKGGDAISICLGPVNGQGMNQRFMIAQLEGQPVVELYRPISATKQTYRFASPVAAVTLDYVAAANGSRAAMRPTPTGYCAEVAIPWQLIDLSPAADLTIPFDVQVIFSNAAGNSNASTVWWNSTGNGPLCTVDLPTEAQLYPTAWGTARLMLQMPTIADNTASQKAAVGVPITFTIPMQAKVSMVVENSDGWIVREMLVAESMAAGAHTITWDGRDDYGDPLPPGNYRWRLGYFQGIGSKRIGGAGNSAKPSYRTPDGKGDLGAVHGLVVAVSADATGVYHLGGCEEGNPGFTKLNVNGECQWKHSLGGFGVGRATATDEKYVYMIVTANGKTELVRMDSANGRDVSIGAGGPRVKLGNEALAIGELAIVGNSAYFSVTSENRIGVVDLTTGTLKTSLAIPHPTGICKMDETHLYVCTDNSLKTFDLAGGQSTLVANNLDSPRAVCTDAAGQIYVAEHGARQQITIYTPQGQVVRHLGRAGGRPATSNPYDPQGLYQVCSVAIGPDGNVWFIEDTNTRRMGVLTPQGTWVKDIFPTIPSQGGAGVDLDDMSRVFYHPGYGSLIAQAKIDYKTGQWNLESLYNMTQTGNYTEPASGDLAARSTGDVFAAPVAFTGTNKIRYYWQEGRIASLWLLENGRMVPVQLVGGRGTGDGAIAPGDKYYSWSDANGDGKQQADEVESSTTGLNGARWMGRDLTIYGLEGFLKPYKVDPRGVPYYHPGSLQPYITEGNGIDFYLRDAVGMGIQVSPPNADGGSYFTGNLGAAQERAFWDRCTYSRLVRVKDGKVQWVIGKHDGRKLHTGDQTFIFRPQGEVDDVVVVGDVDFHLMAYTSDGLELGDLMPHPQRQLTPESIVQENVQSGHFFRDPITGKPLVVIGSGTEALTLEVTGMEPGSITRMNGTVTLPTAQPLDQQTAKSYAILNRTWLNDNGLGAGMDGESWGDWADDIPSIAISDEKALVGDVRLRRDCGNLYLFASVITPQAKFADPASAAVTQYGKIDGVELLLGGWKNDDKVGVTRIFMTAQNINNSLRGSAFAIDPGKTAPVPMPDIKVVVREMLNRQGYHLEAEIPLSLLPEYSKDTMVTFKRNYWPGGVRGGTWNEKFTERKRDFLGWRGPLQMDVAILQAKDGVETQRISWTNGVELMKDYRDTKNWGLAAIPVGASPVDEFSIADRVTGNALYTNDATVRVESNMAANTVIQRYLISELRDTPLSTDPRWGNTLPINYTIIGKEGDTTLTMWAQTADGSIWSSQPAMIYFSTARSTVTATPVITSDLADTCWVRWQTTADCYAYAAYRAEGEIAWRSTPLETAHGKSHRHQLLGLVPGKRYEVEIHDGTITEPIISYTQLPNYRTDAAPEIPLAGLHTSASSCWSTDSDSSNALNGIGYGWRNNQSDTGWWQIDLGKRFTLGKLTYQGRTNDAMIKEFNIYLSDSLSDWGAPIASGQFTIRDQQQEIPILDQKAGRYLRVDGISRNIIPGYIGMLRLRAFGTAVE